MKDVWGLILAATALFLVWLWATGRFAAVWQGVVTGKAGTAQASPATTAPATGSAPNPWNPLNYINSSGGTVPVQEASFSPGAIGATMTPSFAAPTFSIPNSPLLDSVGSLGSVQVPQYISGTIGGQNGVGYTANLSGFGNLIANLFAPKANPSSPTPSQGSGTVATATPSQMNWT